MTVSVDRDNDLLVLDRALPVDHPDRSPWTRPISLLDELPAIDAHAVPIANRLYRRRRATELSVDGLTLRLHATFVASGRVRSDEAVVDIAFAFGGSPALLRLPRRIVDQLIALVDRGLESKTIDGGFAALLLELALAQTLDCLESRVGCRISILSVSKSGVGVPLDTWQPIHLTVVLQDETAAAVLFLDEQQADLAAHVLADLPADPIDGGDLPIEIALRVGIAHVSAGELSSLRSGDVVFLDQRPAAHDRIAVVVAERWVFLARTTRSGISLMTPRLRAKAAKMEEWTMGEQGADITPAGLSADADFHELPIRLVFEIARQSIPLGELRTLAPGHVFDFGRDLTQSVSIYGNGRHIGHGELVRIGDALGLRVTRLFGNE